MEGSGKIRDYLTECRLNYVKPSDNYFGKTVFHDRDLPDSNLWSELFYNASPILRDALMVNRKSGAILKPSSRFGYEILHADKNMLMPFKLEIVELLGRLDKC